MPLPHQCVVGHHLDPLNLVRHRRCCSVTATNVGRVTRHSYLTLRVWGLHLVSIILLASLKLLYSAGTLTDRRILYICVFPENQLQAFFLHLKTFIQ